LSCTVAVACQKGGTGKTTTAMTVATALAGEGRRVLLVDLDPQGSLSISARVDVLGLDRYQREYCVFVVDLPERFLSKAKENTRIAHRELVDSGFLARLPDWRSRARTGGSTTGRGNGPSRNTSGWCGPWGSSGGRGVDSRGSWRERRARPWPCRRMRPRSRSSNGWRSGG
jgi:hypothetical protein